MGQEWRAFRVFILACVRMRGFCVKVSNKKMHRTRSKKGEKRTEIRDRECVGSEGGEREEERERE